MASITGQSPSLDKMVGGPTTATGGDRKPGGFNRPSGNENASSDTRVAPNVTPAGR